MSFLCALGREDGFKSVQLPDGSNRSRVFADPRQLSAELSTRAIGLERLS